MFNRILGTLTGRTAESVYILAGGIEWDISIPSRGDISFGEPGCDTEVYTWLQHYEDGMRLFGFPDAAERKAFLDLMKVEGVGPKQALKILSGMGPAALARALDSSDLKALQGIPGVGPKLAQKMVLALKGKLVEAGQAEAGSSGGGSPQWADLVRSLVEMGFEKKAVEAAVRTYEGKIQPGQEGERELFRLALMDLSMGGRRE